MMAVGIDPAGGREDRASTLYRDWQRLNWFAPQQPEGVARGNWIQTPTRRSGWFVILRLYSPLEPLLTKELRPSETELVN